MTERERLVCKDMAKGWAIFLLSASLIEKSPRHLESADFPPRGRVLAIARKQVQRRRGLLSGMAIAFNETKIQTPPIARGG